MKKGLHVVFNLKVLLLSVFLLVVYCGKSQIITENFEGVDWVGGSYTSTTTVAGAAATPTSAKSSSFYMSTISVLSTNVTTGNSAVRSGTRAVQLQATSASFIITPIIKGGVTVLKAWVRPNNNGTAGCRFAIGYATNTSILTSTSSGSLASQIGTAFVWSSASTGAFPVTSSTWGAWSGNTYGMTHTNSTSAAVSSTINGGTNLTPAVYQQLTLTMNATGDAFFKFQRMGAGMFNIDDIEIINVLKPTATAATSVTSTSATANWNAASGADSYKLNVARYNASEPFISEYIEGSSNNKYIEIFNPTPNSIDLSGYTLRLYSNGASTVTTETALSGTLVSGGTAVFKNSSATVYSGTATTNSAVNFTGNDAIVLYKTSSASNIDIFGRISEDPGAAGWNSNNHSTLDRTLVRKKTVTQGVTTNPSSGFPTLETEWDLYITDDITYLGSHAFANVQEITGLTGTSQSLTSLTSNVTYYYSVQSFNSTYNSPPSNVISFTTTATAPTTQASSINFSSIATTSMTINWTRGNGSKLAVFVKDGSGAINNPSDNTTYTPNTVFGSGTQLGSSSYYCVYNGTGTSVSISGLTMGNTYYVQAFEYNGSAGAEIYYTSTATNNPNSQLAFAAATVTTNAANSIGKTSATLNATVSANGDLTTNSFEYGTTISPYPSSTSGSPTTTSTQNTSVTASVSSLLTNTLYHFRAKGVNTAGTINGSDATFTTLSNAPTVGAGSSATSTSFTANWTAPTNDGSETYTFTVEVDDDNAFGSINATYSGISSGSTSQVVTGLAPSTTFYFRVKAVNAGGSSAWSSTSAGVTTTSTPTVVLADNGSVSAANISTAANNNILSSFSLAVTVANATLNTLSFKFTGGSLVDADIANYKLYYTTGSSFTSPTLLATVTSSTGTSPISFSGFTQTVTSGGTGYFWVTADVASTATASHTVSADALATGDLGFTGSVSKSGSTSAQGTQTIIAKPTITTGTSSSITTTSVSLNGTANANTSSTTANFEYGTTTSYGTSVAAIQNPITGTSNTTITASVIGLTANTLYHWRANGTNTVGLTNGSDATFTTVSLAPSISTTENTNAQTSATNTSFTAYWLAPATQGAASYTYSLQYSTDNTFTTGVTTISSISSASTSQSITGLTGATTYYYRVMVVNAGGNSAYATSAGITTNATAVVTLAGISTISAGNLVKGSTDNIINNFSLAVTTADATITQVTIPFTNSGLTTSDVTNYKLYYTTSSTFGTSNLLSTVSTGVTITPITFGSLSQTIVAGSTGYFWVTTDIASGAAQGHSITALALVTSNITYSLTTTNSGSVSAQGTQTISSPTYYSMTSGTMSWSDATWSTTPSGPFNQSITATGVDNAVIQGGCTVNLDVNYTTTTGTITINSSGTLNIPANKTLIVAAATTINGTLNIQYPSASSIAISGGASNGTLITTGGTFTINGTMNVDGYFKNSNATALVYGGSQTVAFNNYSVCELNSTGITAAPTATWASNSNLLVTACATTNSLLAINTHYGNFNFNYTSAGTGIVLTNASTGTLYFDGNFTLTNSNGTSGKVKVMGTSCTNIGIIILGDLTIPANTAGRLQLMDGSGSTVINQCAIQLYGNLSVGSGGWLNNQNVTVSPLTIDFKGTGKTINCPSTAYKFDSHTGVTVSGSYTLAASLSPSGTASVPMTVTGTLNCAGFTITGGASSTFTLSSGATLETQATTGVSTTLLPTYATRTLNSAANYIFDGSAAQVTGALLTAANNITLNNSTGLTLSAATAVTGTLTLTSGTVTLGANTLTLTNAISGASSSNYIITNGAGLLKRLAAGISGATLFPVGNSATSYTPLTLTNTGTSQDISVASSATITNTVVFSTKIVNLQWTVTPGGAGVVANITYNWNSSNNAASFSNSSTADLGVYTTGPYSIYSLGTLSGNTASYTGLTLAASTNLMVIGNTNAVYVPALVGFDVSTLTGGSGNYGASPYSATTLNANLSSSGLVRASGLTQSGTAAAKGWGGTGWQNTTSSAAITANAYFTFTVKPSSGYYTSLTTISPFNYRTSNSGPANILIQYSVNGNTYVDILSTTLTLNTSAGSIAQIDLSGISALQNLQSNQTVTFRFIPYNASGSTGTFYIYDVNASTASDLSVNGTVTSCSSTSATPTINPICATATTVTGTSTEADGTSVELYFGGTYTVPSTTATVSSGTWSATTSSLTAGTNVTAYALASGKCVSSVSSTVTVTALPTTSTNGGNLSGCKGSSTVALGGNTPSVGTGLWTCTTAPVGGTTGDITFTSSTTGNTTAVIASGAIAGDYTLVWTITLMVLAHLFLH